MIAQISLTSQVYYLFTYCMTLQCDGETKQIGARRLNFPMLTPKCWLLLTASCQHPTSVSSSGGTGDNNTGLTAPPGTIEMNWFSNHANHQPLCFIMAFSPLPELWLLCSVGPPHLFLLWEHQCSKPKVTHPTRAVGLKVEFILLQCSCRKQQLLKQKWNRS